MFGEQHARGDDHEIGLAERQVAGVVEQAQRQAGRGLGKGHDRPHAGIDGDGPAAGGLHDPAEDPGQEEGVDDEVAAGLERRSRRSEVEVGVGPGFSHRRDIRAGFPDQPAELIVGNRGHLELPFPGDDRGNVARGLGPGIGPADAGDAGAEGVAQADQRPQPPEDLVLAVDHHVLVVDAVQGQAVLSLPEVAGTDDLVPQVDRARLMPAEKDDVFVQIGQGGIAVEPAARGIGDDDVGRREVADRGDIGGRQRCRDGQEFDGKIGPAAEGVELLADPGRFGPGVPAGLDPAPVAPARLRPALGQAVDEDGLDPERAANKFECFVARVGVDERRPRQPGQGDAAQGRGAQALEERPACHGPAAGAGRLRSRVRAATRSTRLPKPMSSLFMLPCSLLL